MFPPGTAQVIRPASFIYSINYKHNTKLWRKPVAGGAGEDSGGTWMGEETSRPVGLMRLWRLSEPSRRGRPAELDVDRVVAAAVGLADRDGIAGATLPRIAGELGVTSMSLYRHVGSKDELLVLMQDAALGPPPDLACATSWRDGMHRWAEQQHRIFLRRPWLARLPVSGPPAGPNGIGWMDAALLALRDTGLDWAAKVGVLSVVSGYARNAAQQTQDLATARSVDQVEAERDYGRALAGLVEPDRFPEAAKLFSSTVFETAPPAEPGPSDDGPEPDSDFGFGIGLILDGVAAAVVRAGT